MTGFYMKRNTGLKWVKSDTYLYLVFRTLGIDEVLDHECVKIILTEKSSTISLNTSL